MSDAVSAREAARIAGLSEAAVRKRIKAGSLHAEKVAGVWQIPLSEVERVRASVRGRSHEPDAPDHERDELRAEVKRLHDRMAHLERLNERLTVLLSNEQAGRLQVLPAPSPLGWIRRLLAGRII